MYVRARWTRVSTRSASPATKAPKLPKALPSVPTRAGTSREAEREMLERAAAPRAQHAEPVSVVHGEQGAAAAAGGGERRQRREVAVHAEHAVGQHQRGPRRALHELRLERRGIAMRVPVERRARDAPGVDQRGVVELVAEHGPRFLTSAVARPRFAM